VATKSRPRAAHLGPERRRPLVLDAALPLFIEHGFGGTSIDMIAAAAGVTRPVVYDCYSNKQDLFHALLEREQRRLVEAALEALPRAPDVSDTERLLTEGFTALLQAAAKQPDSWRLLFVSEHGSDPVVARRVAEARDLVAERVGEVARLLLSGRGVREPERKARLVAQLLVAMGAAAVHLMLMGPDAWDPEELGAVLGKMTAPAERVLAGD
jgi:AcrR family transcriptional regulator